MQDVELAPVAQGVDDGGPVAADAWVGVHDGVTVFHAGVVTVRRRRTVVVARECDGDFVSHGSHA